MSSGIAPFGTDLQPECTVKVVGGKLVRKPIVPSSRQRAVHLTDSSSSSNFLHWATADDRREPWSYRGTSRLLKANHRRCLTEPPPTSSPTPLARLTATSTALPPISEAPSTGRLADSVCLRNIARQLKRVHRCSEKVDDVLMFSGGVDRLQSGSISDAELRRLLHCCGFHLQHDGFSALLEASGAGADKSDNLTNETLVNCQVFCSFLKQLLSDESRDAVAVTVREVEHPPYGRGLRSDNVERSKRQRVYHSSPARLMVPLSRSQPRSLLPMGASEAERGQLSQDTARLLVKVEHTLRDAGWGSDTQFRRLDQALAARDRERTGYLCTEDVSYLLCVLHMLTYRYTHVYQMLLQWNLSVEDTIRTQLDVLYR